MSLSTFNIIHIVVEVISLLSITAYFLQQNSKIMSQIDNLNSTIEEHEDKITEQEKKINSILKVIKKLENREVKEKPPKEDSGGCVDGVCPIPQSYQSFPMNFQIPIPSMKSFFEPFNQSSSQVQEIIMEEDEEDEEMNDEYEKPSSVEIIEEEPNQEIEDEEPLKVVPPPPEPPTVPVSKKKKKKKKNSVTSVPDLDKELEDELNELNA